MSEMQGRYTANPSELSDYLTDEQVQRLAFWLAYVASHGFGEVSITVSRGHVHMVQAQVTERLPFDKEL